MKKLLIVLSVLLLIAGSTSLISKLEANNNIKGKKMNETKLTDFAQVVWDRKSIRKYTNKKVDENTINKILTLVNRAPSAGNIQAYKIYVVRNAEALKSLDAAAKGQLSKFEAPQLLIFVALPDITAQKFGERGKLLFSVQDATIAAAYSQLAIKYYGLDSVWKGGFNPELVSTTLGLDKSEIPVVMIPFGYAAESPTELKPRKPLSELVKFID